MIFSYWKQEKGERKYPEGVRERYGGYKMNRANRLNAIKSPIVLLISVEVAS